MEHILPLIFTATLLGGPLMLLIQFGMLPVALKTAKRKQMSPHLCWLFLIPYVGLIAGFWVACEPEKKESA